MPITSNWIVVSLLLIVTMGIITSCSSSAATNRSNADASVEDVTVLSVATPVESAPVQPTLIQSIAPSVVTANRTAVPSSTVVASLISPIPLPTLTPELQLVELLSETVSVQNQVTISMAVVARSLIYLVQQPVYPAPAVNIIDPLGQSTAPQGFSETPMTIISTTAISNIAAPPLPVDQGAGVSIPPNSSEMLPATEAVDQPLIRPDGELRTARVPILMYHYLSVPPADADIYRLDLSVSPTLFAEHLDRLIADGYNVIPLSTLIAHLMQGTPLPPKPVVLTFDDGYRDNYENALPLLRDRQMTATFFVVMEFINQARPEYLTWEMVSEMAAAGMSFEVHGIDHTSLRGRSQAYLEFQALRGYETLQNRLGVRPYFLSYPAGEFDQQTIDIFQNVGYWAGLTTIQGASHRSDALFELRRVRVRGTTTADELARLLALDW